MDRYITSSFFGIKDPQNFVNGLQQLVFSLNGKKSIYAGDNLIALHRNMGFLEDQALRNAHATHFPGAQAAGLLWRLHVLTWAVGQARRVPGDLVECSAHEGRLVRVVCDVLGEAPDRRFHLFEHTNASRPSPALRDRLAGLQTVVLHEGHMTDLLAAPLPEAIAFLHLALTDGEAAMVALTSLFERLVPGGLLVLDTYGWQGYTEQQIREELWLGERGCYVLELPTGQGIVIR
ncbi:methyltransferase [Pararhodospirillum photometricum]|uniref:Methyltransferase, homolog n=1 Tax=Pararhodospirillum photometricum DSM 122 TaxID=1150469 RepID=H6SSB9_PARPM|nr:methyltransferase [Pararhodospirillum photometricum]CCG07798.1 Methyltransferase, homolog [Pararhodospirillum photometricum DSM 122]